MSNTPADRRDRFRALADCWMKETGHLSLTGQILRHSTVPDILVLGAEDPSLVFEYYSDHGHIVWSMILQRLTGTMPKLPSGAADQVAPGFVGWDVRAVQRAWLQWGQERGLIDTDAAEGGQG